MKHNVIRLLSDNRFYMISMHLTFALCNGLTCSLQLSVFTSCLLRRLFRVYWWWIYVCIPTWFCSSVLLTHFICLYCCSLQTHHVDSTLKRRGNSRFHVVSTCNPRGVFIGLFVSWAEALLSSLLKTLLSSVFRCCSLLLPCVLLVIVSSFNFLLKLFILN